MRNLVLWVPGRVVTGNQSFRVTRTGLRYTSSDAKEYRERVRSIAFAEAKHWGWKPASESSVTLWLCKQRGDIDGCAKITLDALNGIAYEDDRNITELHIYKNSDAAYKGIKIEVSRQ